MHTASSVPMCSATSNAFSTDLVSKSCQSNSHGTTIRCPDEEIGRNSVRPCTSPRMMAWIIGTGLAARSGARHDARAPGPGGVEVVSDHMALAHGCEEGGGVA